MTDHSLITRPILDRVVALGARGAHPLEGVSVREPVLGEFAADQLAKIAGHLALSGAPPEVVRGCVDEVAKLLGVSVNAVWAAHDELWTNVDLAVLAQRNVPQAGRGFRSRGKARGRRARGHRASRAALTPGAA